MKIERLEELVASLIGSGHNLDYYLEEGEELTLEDLHYIDDQVMMCECCGWNFESFEINEEGLCPPCADQELLEKGM